MKQFARRASLAVVLLLLASVGTASAHSAWVLWVRDSTMHRMDYFASQSECQTAALRQAERRYVRERELDRRRVSGSTALHGNEVWIPVEFEWQIVVYECLADWFDPSTGNYRNWQAPHTIDPRGPKGN
jgi:hypothetical protein